MRSNVGHGDQKIASLKRAVMSCQNPCTTDIVVPASQFSGSTEIQVQEAVATYNTVPWSVADVIVWKTMYNQLIRGVAIQAGSTIGQETAVYGTPVYTPVVLPSTKTAITDVTVEGANSPGPIRSNWQLRGLTAPPAFCYTLKRDMIIPVDNITLADVKLKPQLASLYTLSRSVSGMVSVMSNTISTTSVVLSGNVYAANVDDLRNESQLIDPGSLGSRASSAKDFVNVQLAKGATAIIGGDISNRLLPCDMYEQTSDDYSALSNWIPSAENSYYANTLPCGGALMISPYATFTIGTSATLNLAADQTGSAAPLPSLLTDTIFDSVLIDAPVIGEAMGYVFQCIAFRSQPYAMPSYTLPADSTTWVLPDNYTGIFLVTENLQLVTICDTFVQATADGVRTKVRCYSFEVSQPCVYAPTIYQNQTEQTTPAGTTQLNQWTTNGSTIYRAAPNGNQIASMGFETPTIATHNCALGTLSGSGAYATGSISSQQPTFINTYGGTSSAGPAVLPMVAWTSNIWQASCSTEYRHICQNEDGWRYFSTQVGGLGSSSMPQPSSQQAPLYSYVGLRFRAIPQSMYDPGMLGPARVILIKEAKDQVIVVNARVTSEVMKNTQVSAISRGAAPTVAPEMTFDMIRSSYRNPASCLARVYANDNLIAVSQIVANMKVSKKTYWDYITGDDEVDIGIPAVNPVTAETPMQLRESAKLELKQKQHAGFFDDIGSALGQMVNTGLTVAPAFLPPKYGNAVRMAHGVAKQVVPGLGRQRTQRAEPVYGGGGGGEGGAPQSAVGYTPSDPMAGIAPGSMYAGTRKRSERTGEDCSQWENQSAKYAGSSRNGN
jgi:hypothetical protein